MSNLDNLKACFRDVLVLPTDADTETLSYQKHPSWDSVAHMRLIAAIETTFDIIMETDELLGMDSFSKAKDILTRHAISLDV